MKHSSMWIVIVFVVCALAASGAAAQNATPSDRVETLHATSLHPPRGPHHPQADLVIYDDSTVWEDWSWDSTINLANTTPVQSGVKSIAVTMNAAWAGFSLRTGTPVNTSGYTAITF